MIKLPSIDKKLHGNSTDMRDHIIMRARAANLLFYTGISIVITSVVLAILFWPVIYFNSLGYYRSMDEIHGDFVEDRTYYIRAEIFRAITTGNLTVMLLKSSSVWAIMISTGDYNENSDVLLMIRVVDHDKFPGKDKIWYIDNKTPEEIYTSLSTSPYSNVSDYMNLMNKHFNNIGVQVWVKQIPTPMGIGSITLIIFGIMFTVIGLKMRNSKKLAFDPPLIYPLPLPLPPPQPWEMYYPPYYHPLQPNLTTTQGYIQQPTMHYSYYSSEEDKEDIESLWGENARNGRI